MPEEPEIDTDALAESIHKELERERGALLTTIALTTAIFAAVAALAALQAAATVNEALVLKTEAARMQAEASDQWADYQAKGIKSAIQQASQLFWTSSGKSPPAQFDKERERYARERALIERLARDKEHERDHKSTEADQLLREHHKFADSVALLQVAIALGAVAALTRTRPVWFASLLLGLIGAGFFLVTIL
jgi:Domain of unknown function (DUF4337)